jgi:hypothetical protein
VKPALKISFAIFFICSLSGFWSCKKDKIITDSSAKLEFSQDSILFDTVFTTIGSSTRNFRIRNRHDRKIVISSVELEGGPASQFKINIDGVPGTSFSEIEIAPHDSMYVFVQVNVNPTNSNSPLIVSDALHFFVNGNEQKVPLEAWGQDAYYHRPDSAVKFRDGTYFPYSVVKAVPQSYTMSGTEYVWKNDKPHVVYGYLVVDSAEKLRIPENTKVYLNYKAGLWVLPGGQLQVLGQKGKEVVFQGARREKEYTDEPGQWDRIWINEGSDKNKIDYAIIKNGFIGVQAEVFGSDTNLIKKRRLDITNTKIQNMSMWGVYCLAYNVYGWNSVISNCQEHSLNIVLGGGYRFIHCTFANYMTKGKTREKAAVNINNYSTLQTIPLFFYMGNSIIDGRLDNELTVDVKNEGNAVANYTFSNSWMKTSIDASDQTRFINNRLNGKDQILRYKDIAAYDFEPAADESRVKNFVHPMAAADAVEGDGRDIKGQLRKTTSVTAGAYELP